MQSGSERKDESSYWKYFTQQMEEASLELNTSTDDHDIATIPYLQGIEEADSDFVESDA